MTVRYGDRIAYLTHDALDALRAGVLEPDDFPTQPSSVSANPAGCGSTR